MDHGRKYRRYTILLQWAGTMRMNRGVRHSAQCHERDGPENAPDAAASERCVFAPGRRRPEWTSRLANERRRNPCRILDRRGSCENRSRPKSEQFRIENAQRRFPRAIIFLRVCQVAASTKSRSVELLRAVYPLSDSFNERNQRHDTAEFDANQSRRTI